MFQITGGNQLSFIAAPDYENPGDADTDNVYELELQADDGNGMTTLQTVLVTVTPVNDNAPVFTSPAAASVAENTTAVQTIAATDADLPAQSVSFTITGNGPDDALFTITVGNQLSFIAPPNFETLADANIDRVYEVEIKADDDSGFITTQTVSVTVTNVDPTTPVDVDSDANTVPESALFGTVVGITASASDPLEPAVTYSLTNDAGGRFEINPSTGVVTVDNDSLLDGPATHMISVQATDGAGGTSTEDFVINVTNVDPMSNNDSSSTSEDSAVVIDVLNNDDDPAGSLDPLTITGTSGGGAGVLITTNGSTVTYDPNRQFDYLAVGESIIDTFAYDISDGDSGVNTATVTVNINGANDAPEITSLKLEAVIDDTNKDDSDDRRTVDLTTTGDDAIFGQKLILTGTFGDVDVTDSHTVTVNWNDGTIETFNVADVDLNDDGHSFELMHTYTTENSYSISVTVDDGTADDFDGVAVDVVQSTIQDGILAISGTDGDNEITVHRKAGHQVKVKIRESFSTTETFTLGLNEFNELLILGLDGNDFIAVSHALLVPTVLDGGAGHDAVFGGRGNDKIIGGEGGDLLIGRAGDDTILGGAGNDFLKGNNGDDCLDGGTGNDAIASGNGQDTASGGEGYDLIWGQNQDDLIFGNEHDDWLVGGNGDDTIDGGTGDDAIWGGNGNDVLFGGEGNDYISGGNGSDMLIGEEGNDLLFGGDGHDLIEGGEGNDLIDGGNGNDVIDGGSGDDIIFGGRGNDDIDGGEGDDWIFDRWRWIWC